MRNAFADQLDAVVEDLGALNGLVQQAVTQASHALLKADGVVAEQVIADDVKIDRLGSGSRRTASDHRAAGPGRR